MADNVTLPGTGDDVAADDIGGVKHQRVKVSLGADGSATDALGGAGAVAAGVQRVTLASDDPAVTAIASTNTKLDTLAGYVDGIETLIGSSNTKLDTLHADLGTTLAGYLDGVEGGIGSLTETAPASDTASSGLNGRLQRIAQRITSLIALVPASLGTKTAANSLAVTLASDDAAIASLSVLDDWDESDRAKVNLIVGQAGVAAGAGAVAATVQRVTLASDDPAVAVLGATTGAAVITDADGTIQRYLRGIVKLLITSGTIVLGSLPAGTALIGKVKTKFIVAAGTALTRAANQTPYTANDAVSNSATPGSVTANVITVADLNNEPLTIERFRLDSNDTGFAGKAVRVWLYNSDPTASSGVVGGDNLAFSNKKAGFIGTMSGTFRTFSDGAAAVLVPDEGARIITTPGSGAQTIWWQLQALEAATSSASSTTFTPTVEGFQGAAN
ncbi:hypothetical protein NKI61_20090 [Mesorhizobium sp. M0514]|uniref:hypothetical protein n=1 Tax=Mesorhizobium sp. M0514 TaxID=2956955 RepID=UPI003339A47C